MKKKLILLFTIGFMFMIPIVKADVNKFLYLHEFTNESGSVAPNKFTYYGKEYVPNKQPNTIDAFSLYADNFSIPSNSVSLVMGGYFQFSLLYEKDFFCNDNHLEEDGTNWCTDYSRLSEHGLSFQIQLAFDGNTTSSFCETNMVSKDGFFSITCPIVEGAKKIERVIFRTISSNFPYANIPTVFLGVRRDVIFLVSETNSITNAIQDQTQQQHQDSQAQLNEAKKQTDEQKKQNNFLQDSSIDTSQSDSFFTGFDDSDHGGLSGVVTAPLRFVNKLTNTCEPISFTIFDKEINLPCGDTLFWNRPDVSDFRTIWNILFGGAILYALVVKLFKTIESLKNPDDSRVEVMDL